MHSISIVFACLACVGDARRAQAVSNMRSILTGQSFAKDEHVTTGSSNPLLALAMLLVELSPEASFMPSGSSFVSRPVVLGGQHRHGGRAPVMTFKRAKDELSDEQKKIAAEYLLDNSTPTNEAGFNQVKADATYNLMIDALMGTQEDLAEAIEKNYHMIDLNVLKKLQEKATEEGDPKIQERAQEVLAAIRADADRRTIEATKTMEYLFDSPSPQVMDGKMAALCRQGKVDNVLQELLIANKQMAEQAGEQGKNAVRAINDLLERIKIETDKSVAPPVRLFRQLLREDDLEKRRELLKEKLAPKKGTNVLIAGEDKKDSIQDRKPEVESKDLFEVLEQIKSRFGNVDENYDSGFVQRVEDIIDDAEAVTKILSGGKIPTREERLDYAHNVERVSIWDLAAMEEEAHEQGKMAVWEEDAQQQFARQEERARKASGEENGQ